MVRLVVAISVLALLLPVAATGSAVEARITSGSWHGVKWEFRGGAWRDGSYCVSMLLKGHEIARGCGNVHPGGIAFSAGGTSRQPNYVMGAVIPRARTVRVEFYAGARLRLDTIAAPRSLQGGERFFVAVLPCPAHVKKLDARDAAGRAVARLAWRGERPKGSC